LFGLVRAEPLGYALAALNGLGDDDALGLAAAIDSHLAQEWARSGLENHGGDLHGLGEWKVTENDVLENLGVTSLVQISSNASPEWRKRVKLYCAGLKGGYYCAREYLDRDRHNGGGAAISAGLKATNILKKNRAQEAAENVA
jgi:hypothetical protein